MPLIDKLTPEQEALIPVYREKWRKIGLSTDPIDREKVAKVLESVYALRGLAKPEILFFDSPILVKENFADRLLEHISKYVNSYCLEEMRSKPQASFRQDLEVEIGRKFWSPSLWPLPVNISWDERLNNSHYVNLEKSLKNELTRLNIQVGDIIDDEISSKLYTSLKNELEIILDKVEAGSDFISDELYRLLYGGFLQPEILSCEASLYDFGISVLNWDFDSKQWELFQAIIQECGWIKGLKEICFVCDRPRILSFDNQQRLHAEGSPAIQFADGFSVYAYHRVRLPEEYSKVHPSQWRSKWLLTEENAELRRVLIQGIGYARICQELQAIELDSWQEYSLLKIDNDIDVEPIYMLKMSCPSTGYIHALRVPPDMQTAREAIKWVNWGIDPEEFAVQT